VGGTAELDNITIGGAQGSDGQVLTSTGSAVAWEDAGGGGGGATLTGTTNNTVTTVTGADAIVGEANLTFDGADLNIVNGNLIVADGHGIDFSAHGQATNMTSELLDDYEEGTWTGVFEFGGGSTSIVYTAQDMLYTKVGRIVHISGQVSISNKGSSTGNAKVAGFPYTASNVTGARSGAGAHLQNCSTSGSVVFDVLQNGTGAWLREVEDSGTTTTLTSTEFGVGSSLRLDITYVAA
jgi:hypothetical protein